MMLAKDAVILAKFVLVVLALGLTGMVAQIGMTWMAGTGSALTAERKVVHYKDFRSPSYPVAARFGAALY